MQHRLLERARCGKLGTSYTSPKPSQTTGLYYCQVILTKLEGILNFNNSGQMSQEEFAKGVIALCKAFHNLAVETSRKREEQEVEKALQSTINKRRKSK